MFLEDKNEFHKIETAPVFPFCPIYLFFQIVSSSGHCTKQKTAQGFWLLKKCQIDTP